MNAKDWSRHVIKQSEIDKYLINGKDFIDETSISENLAKSANPDPALVHDILKKSLEIKLLSPQETAVLLNVKDKELWKEMKETALEVKKKVYDNRIVFFAPLYCSNLCVNSCRYCGFRCDNKEEKRHVLSTEEIKNETISVINEGHKRLIAVYGEHPLSDADYIADSMSTIYSVKCTTPSGNGFNNIRRVNVNAAPMCVEDLKKLWRAGLGTYQVFQETYHKGRYAELHPVDTVKGNYRWRLYAMHRAMDAGIDDVAIGALFGLYDWRFEVMGLVEHAHDLERQFGIGPHTISFPRMQPAPGSFISQNSPYLVNDDDFKKLVTVLRLAVPYTGLIVTAREHAELRREIIGYGCTQTDASTKIGIGAYSKQKKQEENIEKVQFLLGDQRSLDEVVRELAVDGYITSFCTAGYRCGRTGDKIMNLLESGTEGKFCKLNAVLTFREFLNDYASPETRIVGETLIEKELKEIEATSFFSEKQLLPTFLSYYHRLAAGERDLYI
ncbi:MAG: [FeFe] hydrogenase H-cluster radical SAM maturase HydG [Culturomica sp.]|jgi:2-iminoacetate synthase|nr:[FeFe] hydrogenase H-cluster radical SAM maturase HydG [Culturomica sp.]